MNTLNRKIYTIDAADKTVGRIATQIATILRGKNHPDFDPAKDNGSIVNVSNIAKLKFTGKKFFQKKYYSVSGYPGGLKTKKLNDIFAVKPAEILKKAVREMLPPVSFRNKMLRRLNVK